MKPAETVRTTCPVCDGAQIRPVIRIPGVPVLCNFLYSSADAARKVDRGDIELVLCLHCGHLYNASFNPGAVNYRPGYENALHCSGCYRTYAQEQADSLLQRYRLAGSTVIDIGCGSGYFLELLQNRGQCPGIGFEPAMDADSVTTSSARHIRIIADTFSSRYRDIQAKLYAARHVVEHLADPLSFLQTVRSAMIDWESVLYLEVPDSSSMLARCSAWELIYEHYSYFTAHSLIYLLHRAGFSTGEPRSVFNGQFLAVEARPSQPTGSAETHRLQNGIARTVQLTERFIDCYRSQRHRVKELLLKEQEQGRRLVLWGAGSKGIAFVNAIRESAEISCLIDINPAKQGKYIPGTGHEVMPPEYLADHRPDTVLIANNIYHEEIRARLDSLKVTARMHCI